MAVGAAVPVGANTIAPLQNSVAPRGFVHHGRYIRSIVARPRHELVRPDENEARLVVLHFHIEAVPHDRERHAECGRETLWNSFTSQGRPR